MIIKKIGYSKTYEIAGVGFQKIWMEAELEEADSVLGSMDKIKEAVESSHRRYVPQLDDVVEIPVVPKTNGNGKLKPDREVRKSYKRAVENLDEKMIQTLEKIYEKSELEKIG